MTATEKLYQLLQGFSESQINEVLDFAEFLHHKQLSTTETQNIPPGTLTGLRGIVRQQSSSVSTDDELQANYIDYLIQKYQ